MSTFVIQKVNKLLMLIKGKVPLNLKHVVDSLESVSSSILFNIFMLTQQSAVNQSVLILR